MNELRIRIQREARRALQQEKVDLVIGYGKVENSWKMRPVVVFKPEETQLLDFNSFCYQNLATYIPRIKGRVGIVAKPCDVRTIVQLINENQIRREDLFIIGVNCPGMLDYRKVIEGRETLEHKARLSTDQYPEWQTPWCTRCKNRVPPIYDVLVEPGWFADEKKKKPQPKPSVLDEKVKELLSLSAKKRRKYWRNIFASCTKCDACVQSCPLSSYPFFPTFQSPLYMLPQIDKRENHFYLTAWGISLAGRCSLCGACESACPENIPLTQMLVYLEKLNDELLGVEAGTELTQSNPFGLTKDRG
jgi:ferredoxin